MSKKLYVGNLSYDTTEATLTEFFRTAGEVVSTNVIRDQDTGRSRGFGFVEMATQREAQLATGRLNGSELDGRMIKVNEARPQGERRQGNRDSSGGGWGRRW